MWSNTVFFIWKGTQKNQLRETLMEVGFTFFLILARMQDIDPLMISSKFLVLKASIFLHSCILRMLGFFWRINIASIFAALQVTPDQKKAYEFYQKNSLSIEIIKDDVLQKVNFRVKNKVCSLLQTLPLKGYRYFSKTYFHLNFLDVFLIEFPQRRGERKS